MGMAGAHAQPTTDVRETKLATGTGPCSFIALKLGTLAKPNARLRHNPEYRIDGEGYDGGIPYEDEDPAIYDSWVEEIGKSGVTPQLPRPEYAAR
jgi:hypothetical protein